MISLKFINHNPKSFWVFMLDLQCIVISIIAGYLYVSHTTISLSIFYFWVNPLKPNGYYIYQLL
jgi:hypothetical protein